MAQTRKKKTTSATPAKTKQAARSKTRAGGSATAAAAKQPRRREIAALICLLLGLLSFIGYFDSEPLFIAFFTGFAKRLIGYGFYALPPALIMCSVILAFHRGYPVLLRTISTLSLTAGISAFVHSIAIDEDKYSFSLTMLRQLWTDGSKPKPESGGVIGGVVSELFYEFFGPWGTRITLLILLAILTLIAFNATLSGVLSALKRHKLPQYEIEDNSTDTAKETEELQQARHKNRFPLIPQRKKKIDIPLDETGTTKKDYFADDLGDDAPPWDVIKPEQEAPEIEDIPLDIPFMDGRMRRTPRPPVVPVIEEVNFMNNGSDANIDDAPIEKPPYTRSTKRKLPFVPEPEGAGTQTDTDQQYVFPPPDLLVTGQVSRANLRSSEAELERNSQRLTEAFQSFGISVNITNTTCGPSVTRYEAELEAGVKLNRITNLADDIALALGTLGVRIAAMPNKRSTVGIEVPNKNVSKVHLRDIIETDKFRLEKSKLTFAIGMDISGERILGDIGKLPHLLIAGTTGSGKSVCLNSIILSLLYKAKPEEVRLIMIDPKLVEFKVYANIPHLLVPLVTEAKKAAGALQWATFEMMRRYNLFAEANARDIEGYNVIARKSGAEIEPIPRIVIIIDELADLMLTAAKEVEEYVCRVAQMGRAAGIHLVIATQSPRANVITGLMKANIPSRIAFKVASALESQIILDPGQNADKLVGNGDMLFSPTGIIKPMRVQGTWVSDKEREAVVSFIEKNAKVNFDDEANHEIDKLAESKESRTETGTGGTTADDYDELLPQAVDVFLDNEQASVSLLQRRLRLGYARAARIVDQMEEMGIIGTFEGSKSREMLISREQWQQMQYSTGVAPVEKHFPE